jgi:FG-GAP-like repeat
VKIYIAFLALTVSVLFTSLWFSSNMRSHPPAPDEPSELVLSAGKSPGPVAVADVNHDGNVDILVANTADRTLSVFLGDGQGHFRLAAGALALTGEGANDIATGDFNRDGNLDLVIANTGTPFLTVLLGDGKGAFRPSPKSPFATNSYPHVHGVAVGDFNGDGKLGVVTDSWGNDQILLLPGDGAGNLIPPGRPFHTGKRPYQRLRSADFNHDGRTDVVTTDMDINAVSILLGDGKGGFQESRGSPFSAGAVPWSVVIDDLDKDGNLDLAVLPYDRDVPNPKDIGITVLLGDGKGGFAKMPGSPFPLTGCKSPDRVAAGDFNGDGVRDLVATCAQSNNLVLFLGRKEGGFQVSTRNLKEIGWAGLAVGDFNRDGKDDIVVSNNASGTVTILFGK